jgi:protein TonB
MNLSIPVRDPGALEFRALEPRWGPLPWLIPGVLATWAILVSMGIVLDQRPPERTGRGAVAVTILEPPPPPPPVAGLAGPSSKPMPVKTAHREKPKAVPRKAPIPPPVSLSLEAAVKSETGIAVSPPAPPNEKSNTDSEGGVGTGGDLGLGTDSIGAHAIYAPVPKIPDEMREQNFQAVAVAHFTVSSDGTVKVVLVKPTPDPRLNQILLATLEQWRFFPAVKDGVAIDSAFDVKIPISVQ